MTHIGHTVLERYSFKNLSLFFSSKFEFPIFKHYNQFFPMSLFWALPPGDVSFESMSSEGLDLGGLGALLLVNFKYIIFMARGPDGPPKKREPQRTG